MYTELMHGARRGCKRRQIRTFRQQCNHPYRFVKIEAYLGAKSFWFFGEHFGRRRLA